MRRLITAACVLVVTCAMRTAVWAEDEHGAADVVDKAIAAAGGKEKLAAVKAITWKGKGTITLGDNANEFTSKYTAQGLDHFRGEFQGQFNGGDIKGVTVVDGDKGWRKFNDNLQELDNDALANEKRNVYLQVIPVLLVQLKDKDFKLSVGAEEKVNEKPAAAVKVTPPDGKEFTLYFDKETGLPAKLVAKVIGFDGQEFTQETLYGDYKEFNGIKKATHIETKRDGEKFVDYKVSDFKAMEKADEDAFKKPDTTTAIRG